MIEGPSLPSPGPGGSVCCLGLSAGFGEETPGGLSTTTNVARSNPDVTTRTFFAPILHRRQLFAPGPDCHLQTAGQKPATGPGTAFQNS